MPPKFCIFVKNQLKRVEGVGSVFPFSHRSNVILVKKTIEKCWRDVI